MRVVCGGLLVFFGHWVFFRFWSFVVVVLLPPIVKAYAFTCLGIFCLGVLFQYAFYFVCSV